MKRPHFIAATSLAILSLGVSATTSAQDYNHNRYRHYHHYNHRNYDRGHGNCLRFNKTTGTVAGAVGGGLLGHALFGGAGGAIAGAAAGGLAGHELAHNRRKRC